MFTSYRSAGYRIINKRSPEIKQIASISRWQKFSLRDGGPKEVSNDEILRAVNKKSFERCFQRIDKYVFKLSSNVWFEAPVKSLGAKS